MGHTIRLQGDSLAFEGDDAFVLDEGDGVTSFSIGYVQDGRGATVRSVTLFGEAVEPVVRFCLGDGFRLPPGEVGLWVVIRRAGRRGRVRYHLQYYVNRSDDVRRDFFCWDRRRGELRPANFVGEGRHVEFRDE
jgi:hypothetical protein